MRVHNSLINNELVRITGRTPVALAILLFSTGTLLAVLLVATGDKGIGDLSREPTGVVRELQRRARPFNLPHTSAEDIAFRARSNEYVHAYFVVPDAHAPCPAVLYLHRSSETRDVAFELARELAPRGLAVFAADMPGFGTRAIEGAPSDPATLRIFLRLATEEARDAIAFLRQSPRIDHRRILVMGASLGARVAALLANREPVSRLVLLVPGLAREERSEDQDELSLRAFRGLQCPTLVVTAEHDHTVPADVSQFILSLIRAPLQHVVTGGDHRFPFTQVATVVSEFLRND